MCIRDSEVSRAGSHQADPETQPGPRVADLYVMTGRILWQEDAGREPVAVNAPVRLTLNDKPLEAIAVQQLPQWLSPEAVSQLDQRAAANLERELQVRPVALALRELVDHRQREVQWLAMRCLGYLGDFSTLVSAINDPDQKTLWQDQVEQLRQAVFRSPETAAAVRAAMRKAHGAEGTELYDMLWKYSEDRRGSQDATQLVRYLDHETLAFRVLGFWTLKRITGLSLLYRPDDPAPKRQPSIARWKDRLKSLPPVPAKPQKRPSGGEAPTSASAPAVEEGG